MFHLRLLAHLVSYLSCLERIGQPPTLGNIDVPLVRPSSVPASMMMIEEGRQMVDIAM